MFAIKYLRYSELCSAAKQWKSMHKLFSKYFHMLYSAVSWQNKDNDKK